MFPFYGTCKIEHLSRTFYFISIQHTRINHQIRVPEVRAIGKDGENLGIISTQDALRHAEEAGLDLIEISTKAVPPVVRIMDYGKYQYQKEKEARESAKKQKGTEIRAVRIGFNASPHDMELKAKKADEFLEESNRLQVEFILKGRAKYLDKNFIHERLNTFLSLITTPHQVSGQPKKGPRGLSLTIEKTSK